MIKTLTGETIEPESKFNKEVMWSSRSDEWETPQDIFNDLDKELGPFTLDVCASETNHKTSIYFSKEENGLIQDWGGHTCWMNPPHSENAKWVKKAYNESCKPNTTVVCLLPARTDTRWFHRYCVKGRIWFIKGRLKFGDSENSAPFPSMVVIFE